MLKGEGKRKRCDCSAPHPAGRKSAALGIIGGVLAALAPKCPYCVLGLLAAVGASSAGKAIVQYISPGALSWTTALLLFFAVGWFAVRGGVPGAVCVGVAATLIACGKYLWTSTLLVVVGIAVLFGYSLLGERIARVLRPSRTKRESEPQLEE